MPLPESETTAGASDQTGNTKLCVDFALHGRSYYISDSKNTILKYNTDF